MNLRIKTYGQVSMVKKDVWDTSVLFRGSAKFPFSTIHISGTSKPICTKFTLCYVLYIYNFTYVATKVE